MLVQTTEISNNKSFAELMKDKVNRAKNNNRKHSNQRFYMLYLSYKIMKKILYNPDITIKELKLVNSNFSRNLLSSLLDKNFIKPKYKRDPNDKNQVYELTIEGLVYIDFIDTYFVQLGYPIYDSDDLAHKDEDNIYL